MVSVSYVGPRGKLVHMSLKKIKGVVVEPLLLPTYLSLIEASVGTPMFRNFWALVNGKKTDIARGGRVSCSFYVSSILKLFNLTSEVQVTVNRLKRDMEESGWMEIPRPKKGCVVFWLAKPADTGRLKKDKSTYQPMVSHCGFFIGGGMTVNNDGDKTMTPQKMPLNYRPVEKYYWHDALGTDVSNPARKAPKRLPGIYWHPNK